ncbi:MAG: hypothetical protein ACJARP_002076 [Vicingaceae bacterium]|jgi:hypothetical protein
MKAFIRYYTKDYLTLFLSKLRFWLSKKTPILVYTMAKVGSLSIYSSIKKQTSIPCFHLHSLNLEEIKNSNQICFNSGMYPDSRNLAPFVVTQIIAPKKACKIISLFRDPVERNISAFFDAFELYVGVAIDKYTGSIDELIACYRKKLPHNYSILWFEKQFKRDLAINVFDFDFNKEAGFQLYKKDNYEILIINSRVDDALKRDLIAEFISEKSFVLNNVNVTSKSNGNELYQRFKNAIRFNQSELDAMLNAPYSQHFFTKKEIEDCYQLWLK